MLIKLWEELGFLFAFQYILSDFDYHMRFNFKIYKLTVKGKTEMKMYSEEGLNEGHW